MADDITLKVAGDSAGGEKAIANVERRFDALEAKLKNMRRTSKQLTDESILGYGRMSTSLAGIVGGYVSATALASGFSASIKETEQNARAAALSIDDMMSKFRTQSGLNAVAAKTSQERILAQATRYAIAPENATAAATQLVSSGFSPGDATGKALEATLQGLAASNRAGEDPTLMVQAASQYLAAQGMDKNAKNLEAVMVSAQRLFKDTDFQISDLSNLAGKSQGFRGRLSMAEQLATFDVLREKTGPDVAATAMKGIVETFTGAGADSKRTKMLQTIGLSPQQIDLTGETFTTALDRVAGGIQSLPPEQRAGFIQQFFGREISSPAEGLMADRGKIPGIMAAMANREGFNKDLAIATSGLSAGTRRQDIEQMRRDAAQFAGFDMLQKEAQFAFEDMGASRVRQSLYGTTASMLKGIGLSNEQAIGLAYYDPFATRDNSVLAQAQRRVEQRTGGSEVQDKLLQSIDTTLKSIERQRKPIDPRGNVEGN